MAGSPELVPPDLIAELFDLIELTTKIDGGAEALQAVTQTAVRLLGGDHASIRLLDPSQRELLSSARSGRGTHLGSLPLARNAGVVGWVLEHAEPVRIDDVRKDKRFVSAMGQGFSIRSMMAEPLWSGGRVVGVLSVSSPEVATFKPRDALVLRILAACAMPLVDRARRADVPPFDELTLAATAECVRPRVEAEITRLRNTPRRFSVAALSLDAFDATIGAYGREVADRVLCVASDRVRGALRVFDAFARVGESDFVIVLVGTDAEKAKETCERIRVRLAESMEPLEGAFLSQTASLGIATWDGLESAAQLEERARAKLDEAHAAGPDSLRA